MTERLIDHSETAPKVRRLHEAVRRVRIAEAERIDAFSDLHEAERARLGMLAEELAGVFAEVPDDDDFFIFRLGDGMPPRLWIDPTGHVVIGRDRRTYRFLKDTRLGRTVILETTDVAAMADVVTDYVAERVIEREKAFEADWLMQRLRSAASERSRAAEKTPEPRAAATSVQTPAPAPAGRTGTLAWMLAAFLFGIAAGAAGLVAYAWFRIPPV